MKTKITKKNIEELTYHWWEIKEGAHLLLSHYCSWYKEHLRDCIMSILETV